MQSEQIFHVIKPGILTTFQDMGRTGFQRFGVPVSGAMDRFALQVANILVGNPRDAACLEVTLMGPELEACTTVTVAITGADLAIKVNGNVRQMWTSFRMNKGDRLAFGKQRSGVRAYIAIAGGFHSPRLFDSQSTDLNSGFGKRLEKAIDIYGFPGYVKHGMGLSKKFIPTYKKSIEVGVVEGPHTDFFTNLGREKFFHTIHQVDVNSNRMGYQLSSEKITFKKSTDIWSDAVPFGGIQIPRKGHPIVLMADRQTTGGYPRIGTVISSDLPKVAQLVSKGEIKFYPISVEAAQRRAIEGEKLLRKLAVFQQAFHHN